MKTNGIPIPKRIYVTEAMLFMTNPEITLRGNGNKIEYICIDVVIKKAREWIKNNFSETDDRFNQDFTGMLINSFCKAIKEDYAN